MADRAYIEAMAEQQVARTFGTHRTKDGRNGEAGSSTHRARSSHRWSVPPGEKAREVGKVSTPFTFKVWGDRLGADASVEN